MTKYKVSLFYRDGDNSKCCWDITLDSGIVEKNDLVNNLDEEMRSENTIRIEDLGLTVNDIPHIKNFGYDDTIDHNFVSVTKIEMI